MKYVVDVQLLQAIVNYLEKRPYKDVWALLAALKQCKPLTEEENNGLEREVKD
jgi:hypothetical protein